MGHASLSLHVSRSPADEFIAGRRRGAKLIETVVPFLPQARTAFPPSAHEVLDLDSVIHSYVRFVLELNDGNKKKTARQLGISRSTLYRILQNQNTPAL
jgi:DNA-binding NtrC family response regulator